MLRFALGRLTRVIPVLLIVTMLVALLLELVPGNPAEAQLGRDTNPEALAALEKKMGLDKPLPERYIKWLGNAVRGDLGKATTSEESVNTVIKERFPISFEIAIVAQVLALSLALTFGTFAAARAGGRFDRSVIAVCSAVQSIPNYCVAIVGIILFAVQRRWFPVTGFTRLTENPLDNLKAIVIPSVSLALVEAAAFIRILRGDLATTLKEDFVLSARAKGLPDSRVLFRHALRPSLFGLVTVAGITLARLIGGTVVIESLFEIPGLGNKLFRALGSRDYTMIQGITAFLAVLYALLSVGVEILYALIDPRVRARVTAR